MQTRARVCRSLTAALVISVAVPVSATAKPEPIAGKLSRPGYTVIALAASGAATTQPARTGKFKLRPRAKRVTLHLRAPDGSYAGPIVVGSASRGKRAIVGVRAGARLGTIKVSQSDGYAKPAHKVARKRLARDWIARARKGVPLGAGSFGLVRSSPSRLSAPRDSDFDGVPDQLDVDDDGDLILDDYDARTAARSAAVPRSAAVRGFPDGSWMHASTSMLAGANTVNVDGGSTDEQIATAQREFGWLALAWTGIDDGSGELDCGALTYCSAGGTGRLITSQTGARADFPAFPECCDADRDGLGSLDHGLTSGVGGMLISHGAASDQIHAGDVLIARGTADGTPTESVSALGFIFSTFSVFESYSDGQGNARTFTYGPVADVRGPPAVKSGPDGDVVLTLTSWRPQRPRIEGEPGEGPWMDVGNLDYAWSVNGRPCPQSSLSTSDPNLSPLTGPAPTFPPGFAAGGFADSAGDQPSSGNTFTYTLNVTRCLASTGVSLHPGDNVGIGTRAIAVGRGRGDIPFAISFRNFVVQA